MDKTESSLVESML